MKKLLKFVLLCLTPSIFIHLNFIIGFFIFYISLLHSPFKSVLSPPISLLFLWFIILLFLFLSSLNFSWLVYSTVSLVVYFLKLVFITFLHLVCFAVLMANFLLSECNWRHSPRKGLSPRRLSHNN